MKEVEMIELIFFIIAILLILYFTVHLWKSLAKKEGSILKNIWRWVVNIFDSITGIG
jgi:hypothetical protein